MKMNNNKKINKKKFNKFGKNRPKLTKPKVKKSLAEDDEINNIKEAYEKLPDFREIKSFNDLPLSRKTRKGLLANKYRVPTEIQKQSIGLALLGKDVLGAAQTGSGKTLGNDFPQIFLLFHFDFLNSSRIADLFLTDFFLQLLSFQSSKTFI